MTKPTSRHSFSGTHPFRVGCLLTALCDERPDLAALPANDPTLAAPVRALNDVADRVDAGICPRCAMVSLPTTCRPAGSRVTRCRCVPICGTCGEHEGVVRLAPVDEWPVPNVQQEMKARRAGMTLSSALIAPSGAATDDVVVVNEAGATTVKLREHPGGWAEFSVDDEDQDETAGGAA